MSEFHFDFESPIFELQKKINELELFSREKKIDVSSELSALNERLTQVVHEIYASLTPWQRIQLSRHPARPYFLDYVSHLCTDFMELSGDRRFGDDKAVVGGFARFHERPVMVIGTQKGRDMKSNVFRNFGWPNPEGYRKALRLMQLADKAGVPVLTFVDTPGAYPGVSSEERHIAEAIAVNLREMFALKVPFIATIIGEGGSGGAIGLAAGNRVLVQENSYYSVITPEGCAAILWKDRKFAPKAAEALQITAQKLLALGVADEVVPEPPGGAHRDYEKAARLLGKALEKNLKALEKYSGEELKEMRYQKFRAMGMLEETAVPAAENAVESGENA